MTALDQLTPIQRAAVEATAETLLADPEGLAAEWLPLLLIEDEDPPTPAPPTVELTVNKVLTPASEPEVPEVLASPAPLPVPGIRSVLDLPAQYLTATVTKEIPSS